jgi:hypothetical protein
MSTICEPTERIDPRPTSSDLVYLLHIPKTSGTSLYYSIERAVGKESAPLPMLWDQFLYDPTRVTERTQVLTGHFGGLILFWLKQWPKMITMLREPLARCLSHLNHMRRVPAHPRHALVSKLTLVECCRHPVLRRVLDNVQSRYLASLSFARALLTDRSALGCDSMNSFEHALFSLDPRGEMLQAAVESLHDMTMVGLCEAHRPSLQLLMRSLGWPAQGEVEELRLNTASDGQQRVEDLTRAERAALREINGVDLELYSAGCQRFRDLCRQFAVEVDGLPPATQPRSFGWRLAHYFGLRK